MRAICRRKRGARNTPGNVLIAIAARVSTREVCGPSERTDQWFSACLRNQGLPCVALYAKRMDPSSYDVMLSSTSPKPGTVVEHTLPPTPAPAGTGRVGLAFDV